MKICIICLERKGPVLDDCKTAAICNVCNDNWWLSKLPVEVWTARRVRLFERRRQRKVKRG